MRVIKGIGTAIAVLLLLAGTLVICKTAIMQYETSQATEFSKRYHNEIVKQTGYRSEIEVEGLNVEIREYNHSIQALYNLSKEFTPWAILYKELGYTEDLDKLEFIEEIEFKGVFVR